MNLLKRKHESQIKNMNIKIAFQIQMNRICIEIFKIMMIDPVGHLCGKNAPVGEPSVECLTCSNSREVLCTDRATHLKYQNSTSVNFESKQLDATK